MSDPDLSGLRARMLPFCSTYGLPAVLISQGADPYERPEI
ncbi:MAG: TADA1 family protein [Chloroflexaceae bacterium]|nr:TADA1 family protein [Chloroflexaceae bacterium]